MNFLKINKRFLGEFAVHSKTEWKGERVPMYPCPHTRTTSPTSDIPHHSGTLITMDVPTLPRRHHPEAIVCTGFTPGVHSMEVTLLHCN